VTREPTWGDPPIPEVLVRLLRERHPFSGDAAIEAELLDDPGGLAVTITTGPMQVELRVRYLRGAGTEDPWMLLADAVDALVGSWLEAEGDPRVLPQGEASMGSATFTVDVQRRNLELERLADQWLDR
jgi:DNA-binding helix-hairpin-helix protein with protein kinase domain